MLRIGTDKTILRTLKKSDAPQICGNISKEVVRWLPDIPYPYKIKDANLYIKRAIVNLENKNGYGFGILFGGKIVGTVSLMEVDKHKKARLAYLLNKDYWKKGIMTEAVKLVILFGFQKLKLNKIYTGVIPENKDSYYLLKKLKFKEDGKNRKHLFIRGRFYDEIIMSLLKSEYDKVRKYGITRSDS
ncbi:MAG: GNAT family protein [Nanoarchaeota archaeon]|nr:GNAT family protein [Nanoarchaeota archaeon]